jgi:tRNA (cmo5U34)-methyltransferase
MDYKKASWHFNGPNAEGFNDHVLRSIPWYLEGHKLTIRLAEFFVKQDDTIYDLGSATGELSSKLDHHFKNKNVKVIGIDQSTDMVKIASESYPGKTERLEFVAEDILKYPYQNSNLFISYYTLQFLPEASRMQMLKIIYDHLPMGGGFILFEKTRSESTVIESISSTLLTEYKLEMGQSADEIVQKLLSLKGVLIPNYTTEIVAMLKSCGFREVDRVFKLNSFEGFLAIK